MSVPRRLGPYELRRPLGRGATGEVWEGFDADGRRVAVKLVLSAERSDDVRRELLTHATLRHPHLLELLDAGDIPPEGLDGAAGGSPYLVTEWASGTLGERPGSIREVLEHILLGLGHLHARGLVHGDLKPSNVLRIEGEDRLKRWVLGDFGIAHAAGSEVLGGTLAYLAPEGFGRGARPGPAADLYALGVIGWKLAMGSVPRRARQRSDWPRVHRDGALPPFEPREGVPEALGAWLRRLLEPAPSARFPHAAAARTALADAFGDDRGGAVWGGVGEEATLFTETMEAVPAAALAPVGATTPRPADPPTTELSRPTRRNRAPRRARTSSLAALRPPAFVGREEALSQLWDALERGAGEPVSVDVDGPPGIGATRLLDTFAVGAAELGAAVRIDDLVGGGGLAAGLARAWNAQEIDDEAILELLSVRLPGLRCGERVGLLREIRGRGRASDAAWLEAIHELRGGRPALWILDDAHAHPDDLARLQRLAPQGVVRIAIRPPSPAADVHIELAPLSASECARLVQSLLPVGPGPVVGLVERAHGHPGTAVALALAAIDPSGAVDPASIERASLSSAAEATRRRAEAVARSIGASPERLVDAAAIHDVDRDSFLRVWGAPAASLVPLQRAGLLGPGFWVHPLLVEGARATMGPGDHQRVLARLGDGSTAARAWHLHRAGQSAEAAVLWLEVAQGHADTGRMHWQLAALDEAERALAVLGDDAPGWSQLWQLRSHALVLRGDRDGAEAAGHRALALARDPADRVQARRRLAVTRSRLRDLDGAIAYLREALAETEAPTGLLGLAAIDLGNILNRCGRVADARALLAELDVSAIGPRHYAAYAITLKQIEQHMGAYTAETVARMDRALESGLDHDLWRGILQAERGDVLLDFGDLDGALAALEAGRRHLEEVGASAAALSTGCNQCRALAIAGRAAEAREDVEDLVRQARGAPSGGVLLAALTVRALVSALEGDVDDASDDLDELARAGAGAVVFGQQLRETLALVAERVPSLSPEVDRVLRAWSSSDP